MKIPETEESGIGSFVYEEKSHCSDNFLLVNRQDLHLNHPEVKGCFGLFSRYDQELYEIFLRIPI